MYKKWWDTPVCWLCDYWWAILLALLVVALAILLRGYWMPVQDFSAIPSATPISTTILPSPTTDSLEQWLHFQGTSYSLDYPADWYAYHPQTEIRDPSGIVYDLILSNASGNQNPQEGTPDEKARITIWYVPQPTESIPAWIAQRWAWLGTALEASQLNGKDVWKATPLATEELKQQFYWIQVQGNLYTVESYGLVDDAEIQAVIQKIISTLKFE